MYPAGASLYDAPLGGCRCPSFPCVTSHYAQIGGSGFFAPNFVLLYNMPCTAHLPWCRQATYNCKNYCYQPARRSQRCGGAYIRHSMHPPACRGVFLPPGGPQMPAVMAPPLLAPCRRNRPASTPGDGCTPATRRRNRPVRAPGDGRTPHHAAASGAGAATAVGGDSPHSVVAYTAGMAAFLLGAPGGAQAGYFLVSAGK